MREKLLVLLERLEREHKLYQDTYEDEHDEYDLGAHTALGSVISDIQDILATTDTPAAEQPAIPVFDERGRKC